MTDAVLRRLAIAIAVCFLWVGCSSRNSQPIRVGILHSATGDLAANEQSVAQATRMAIDEINENGGVLGRRLESVPADGKSDPKVFAQEAQRLIVDEKVDVLFGCWTSASRKAVLPVLRQHKQLLFYPLQYEGLEKSPDVVYTGAAPNQQMVPGIKWSVDNLGKRYFLVGSDYIYPRIANILARFQLEVLGAEVVGEEYLLLGSKDVTGLVERIRGARPDVILNTINGASGKAFFHELARANLKAVTMSFSTTETEFQELGPDLPVGHYATWNYFESIDTPENRQFVNRYKEKYGANAVTSDPMEAGYFGVYLWAQAVESAESSLPEDVKKTIGGQSLLAPEGLVSIDSISHHTWKTVRVGKLKADGQFQILWTSQGSIRPQPFPLFRQAAEWEAELQRLYRGWDDHWMNPAKT